MMSFQFHCICYRVPERMLLIVMAGKFFIFYLMPQAGIRFTVLIILYVYVKVSHERRWVIWM
jgi:hypothetical protein